MDQGSLRIALYSHDAVGIGHVRRNLLIARTLLARRPGSALLLAGAHEIGAMRLPAGVDCLTLPGLRKSDDGHSYHPRRLGLPGRQLLSVRAEVMRAALVSYAPDVLIVDKLPRGICGELDPAIDSLRRTGRTRLVLGLRDILDDPATVRREWARDDFHRSVEAHYDAVWIYGCPRLFDSMEEYNLPPSIRVKTRYTGYFDSAPQSQSTTDGVVPLTPQPDRPYVLCMVGGGEDGGALAEAFVRAQRPDGLDAVLITGPFMPIDVLQRLRDEASVRGGVRVLEFSNDTPALIRGAARIVAMGGYNSVWEILSHRKRALISPRSTPRQEQLIRTRRLEQLGLIDALYPGQIEPEAITRWLCREIPEPPDVADLLDVDGLRRLPELLAEVLGESPGVSDAVIPNRPAGFSSTESSLKPQAHVPC